MTKLDSALWRDMLEYLRRKHGPLCRQWFEQLEPVELRSGLLKIHTSNAVQQNYLQRKCLQQFTEAAQSATGALVAVRFVNRQADQPAGLLAPVAQAQLLTVGQDEKLEELAVTAAGALETAGKHRPAPPALTAADHAVSPPHDDHVVISPDYSFDQFVTGPSNRLAHAAAVAVANKPGTAYNPLFIHGGVGLGKTHLLQAICQTVMQNQPTARICYLSCDAFMNQFLECVQNGNMNDFRHRYRHVDVLMIDDIHFLASRERIQEEFFHTFNELYQRNKQIVLSSDSAPAEIPELEDRLVSRFQWGLVAGVSKPDFDTRVAIVRAKAKLRGLELSDDVMNYVARKIESNARELEGAITLIQGHAALCNRPIDLALAQEALGEPVGGGRSSQASLQHIIEAVTSFYNVRLADLQSKRRHKSITEPRQVCMWLARKRTRFSLEEIGGYFGGRDHTTVMHSIRTVEDKAQQDRQFAALLETIQKNLS